MDIFFTAILEKRQTASGASRKIAGGIFLNLRDGFRVSRVKHACEGAETSISRYN